MPGKRISELRQQRGWSKKELARNATRWGEEQPGLTRVTTVSGTQIGNIERDSDSPRLRTLQILAGAFDMMPSRLVDDWPKRADLFVVPDLPKSVGEAALALREDHGFSQERVANEAQLDPAQVAVLELGDRDATLYTINRLAQGLDIATVRLIRGAELVAQGREPFAGIRNLRTRPEDWTAPRPRRSPRGSVTY